MSQKSDLGKEISPEKSGYASEPSYRNPSDDGSPGSHQQGPHAIFFASVDSDGQPRYLYGQQAMSASKAVIKETSLEKIGYASEHPPPYRNPSDDGSSACHLYGRQIKEASLEKIGYASEHPPPYRNLSDDGSPACHLYGRQAMSASAVVMSQPTPSTNNSDMTMCCSWFACLCCCWPMGLFAIRYSLKARDAMANGDMEKAKRMKVRAQYLIVGSIVIGILLSMIAFVLRAVRNSGRYE